MPKHGPGIVEMGLLGEFWLACAQLTPGPCPAAGFPEPEDTWDWLADERVWVQVLLLTATSSFPWTSLAFAVQEDTTASPSGLPASSPPTGRGAAPSLAFPY